MSNELLVRMRAENSIHNKKKCKWPGLNVIEVCGLLFTFILCGWAKFLNAEQN
jgi:hypothetical protein